MSHGAESSHQQGAMSDEETVREMVTDIYEKLLELLTNNRDSDRSEFVRLWQSLMPNAFTPQIVSLGSQHHEGVLVTEELKLAAIKNLRLDKLSTQGHPITPQGLVSRLAISIQSYSGQLLSTDDNRDLLSQLLVDGLFLLTVLDDFAGIWIYTQRKLNLSPNNPAKDIGAIVGNVFMLENQIPTSVLCLLTSADLHQDLGEKMLHFCKIFAPFFHPKELTEPAQNHLDLLDLAYHLAAPKPTPDEAQPAGSFLLGILQQVPIFMLLFIWIFLGFCVFLIVSPSELILSLISSMLLGVAPWLRPILFIQKEVKIQLGLIYFMRSVVDLFHYLLASFLHLFPFLSFITKHILKINQKVGERTHGWFQKKKDSIISLREWTGSASELHKAGFQIQPTKGGISSIEFDRERFIFYLPRIQLRPVISEMIIPNLMAHESSLTNDVFARYIQLMTILIHTVEDVKVLVNEGIIHSFFQNDADVVELFGKIKPMSEYINGPINTNTKWIKQKTKTKEAKDRLDRIKNLLAILLIFVKVLAVLGIAYVFYPFIFRTILQVGCSTIFSHHLETCRKEDGRNNHLVYSA